MTDIIVQSQTVTDFHVPNVSVAHPPHLRIYASEAFWSDDNPPIYIPSGSPNNGQFYQDIECSWDPSFVVTVPQFSLKPTTDAVAGVAFSRYSFYWYWDTGQQIGPVGGMQSILVPPVIASASSCTPVGTCATWADLANYTAVLVPNLDVSTYTKTQIDAKIAAAAVAPWANIRYGRAQLAGGNADVVLPEITTASRVFVNGVYAGGFGPAVWPLFLTIVTPNVGFNISDFNSSDNYADWLVILS